MEQRFHIVRVLHARNDRQNARFVKRVLDALIRSQRLPERGCLCIEKLTAGERFHDRDADPLFLTPSVKIHALLRTSVRIIAVMIAISRIDGKHHLVHDAGVDDLLRELRCMGGKSDMTDNVSSPA